MKVNFNTTTSGICRGFVLSTRGNIIMVHSLNDSKIFTIQHMGDDIYTFQEDDLDMIGYITEILCTEF